MIKISPSILAADFARLGEEIEKVESAGADLLHIDVMDGHFVPNISVGIPVIQALRKTTKLKFDVHLMIDNPESMLDAFLKAGADSLTFHLEAAENPAELIARIKDAGTLPAVAVKPGTPVEAVYPFLETLSMVLVMTVEPGFGGQKLIPQCLEKAAALRREAESRGIHIDIEADGGIGPDTVGAAAKSGINVFVAGSAVFRAPDPARAIAVLRSRAQDALQ